MIAGNNEKATIKNATGGGRSKIKNSELEKTAAPSLSNDIPKLNILRAYLRGKSIYELSDDMYISPGEVQSIISRSINMIAAVNHRIDVQNRRLNPLRYSKFWLDECTNYEIEAWVSNPTSALSKLMATFYNSTPELQQRIFEEMRKHYIKNTTL